MLARGHSKATDPRSSDAAAKAATNARGRAARSTGLGAGLRGLCLLLELDRLHEMEQCFVGRQRMLLGLEGSLRRAAGSRRRVGAATHHLAHLNLGL